jgi:glutamate-5-semialdehyde dehydrogenase
VSAVERVTRLDPGQPIVYGGDRIARVPADLAASFVEGDRLLVVQDTGDLLHIPADVDARVADAVADAAAAFDELAICSDDQITDFFTEFARLLATDDVIGGVLDANREDLADARQRGRSTTRLELTETMRTSMIEGLIGWAGSSLRRESVIETIDHPGWRVDLVRAPLGVVGFVFEGRPNVIVDACGVVRSGNTAVLRIGSDATRTARALSVLALGPALAGAGLPAGTVRVIDDRTHAAGHALFSHPRLALAVARGSGATVRQLGSVAMQSGVPVSLHGTGGAWMVVTGSADPTRLHAAIVNSLDRKVCNTLNVIVVLADAVRASAPVVVGALRAAGAAREGAVRVHVAPGGEPLVPTEWFATPVVVERADARVEEPLATTIADDALGVEWEWESTPEVSLAVADDLDHAVALFNRHAPRFVGSLISDDADEHRRFFAGADAPFVGDGFTRWVDGQYALGLPELGLSNWQFGRTIGRGAILSGDAVHTIRHRARIDDPTVRR